MASLPFRVGMTALLVIAAMGCSSDSSYDAGSGGQSNGGSGSGGTSAAGGCEAEGTLTVTNVGMTAYEINGASNPSLTLCRDSEYTFDVDAPGHPFYVKTIQGTGTGNAYNNGVTGNGVTTGTLVFNVPTDAPDSLYYNCSIHAAMTGAIHIVDR